MAYYGNPAVVKLYNKNIESLSGANADFEAQIALFDEMVRPILEADLESIFDSWPDPTGKQLNPISILWVYKMSDEIQATKTSTQRSGTGSAPAVRFGKKYDELLRQIKRGEVMIPGAIRGTGSQPKTQPFAEQRYTIRPTGEEPIDIGHKFPHGLRLGGNGKGDDT